MRRLTTLIAACAFALLASTEAAAQSSYTVRAPAAGAAPAYTGWTAFTFTGASGLANTDSGVAHLDLPFEFPFYGKTYGSLDVTADGQILFENTDTATGLRNPCTGAFITLCATARFIPDNTAPNAMIAFWWNDMKLDGPGAAATSTTSGAAPNRVFSLKLEGWGAFQVGSGVLAPRTVQVDLHEGGAIEVFYGAVGTAASDPEKAGVGIENAAGTKGVVALTCTNTSTRCKRADWPAGRFVRIEPDPAPDLAVALVVPSGLTPTAVGGAPGYRFDLATTIANRGLSAAVGFGYDVYVTTNATMDPYTGTKIHAHTAAENLAKMSEGVFTDTGITFTRPQNAVAVFIVVVVDPTNVVAEDSEYNNVQGTPILIGPELRGEISGPARTATRQQIPVRVLVRNIGSDLAGPFAYDVYLSSDRVLDAADVKLHSATLAVRPVDAYDDLVPVTIPSGVLAGTYFYILGIDTPSAGQPNGAVLEMNETNNVATSDLGVQVVVCQALSQCHMPGVLDPVTGNCTNPTRTDGSNCFDGSLCTRSDSCQNGVCVGTNPVTCAAADQCHAAGTCDPYSGVCSNPTKADGTLCDDANACTSLDACKAGTCGGTPSVVCTAKDLCHVAGVCDPQTGTCTDPAQEDGAGCDDGDACTQADVCQAGACVGFSPVTCRAMDGCHEEGVCDPMTGACTTPEKADGTECSDGNACTLRDACVAGVCTGGEGVACEASDPCREAGTCDPETGACSSPARADGTACDDGNACTSSDACRSGTCVGSATFQVAPDECHISGSCDPASGKTLPMPDGTACSAGVCAAGACVATPEPADPAPAPAKESSGCGCGAAGGGSAPGLAMALLGLVAVGRRRR